MSGQLQVPGPWGDWGGGRGAHTEWAEALVCVCRGMVSTSATGHGGRGWGRGLTNLLCSCPLLLQVPEVPVPRQFTLVTGGYANSRGWDKSAAFILSYMYFFYM